MPTGAPLYCTVTNLVGEAAEVATNNNWLTYGEPMHRLREFGVLIKEMDVMDSDRLSPDQIRKFASVMYVVLLLLLYGLYCTIVVLQLYCVYYYCMYYCYCNIVSLYHYSIVILCSCCCYLIHSQYPYYICLCIPVIHILCVIFLIKPI